jgi:hypothetical protein
MKNTTQIDEIRGAAADPYRRSLRRLSSAVPIALQKSSIWKPRLQYVPYVALSLAPFGFTLILGPSADAYYQRFYGRINPILAVVSAALIGGVSLAILHSRNNFAIHKGRATLRGISVSAGMATLLAVAIVIADFIFRYPEDTNVPVPGALLFYPAIGFVAEIAFHVAPLTILLFVLAPLGSRFGADALVTAGIVITAALEPTFQVMFEGDPVSWASAYTWIHVFAIALLQLRVFRRYGFLSMYAFRIVYYLYWHITWGVIRLEVLF